jgi:hypothetical protein
MSTNVIITPVASAAAGTAAAPIVPLLLAAGAVWLISRALAASDEEYAALMEKSREDLGRERLATMQLQSTDLQRLTRSAREVQFQPSSLAPDAVRLNGSVRGPVWAVREPAGIRLVGNEQALRRLVVANTASRAIEHLEGKGYRVKATTKRSGEIHISANGRGREIVDVVVGGHGEATVDPQHFTGRECETVVRDLATAIEGTVVRSCPKPEYFTTAPVKICGATRG